MMVIVKDAINKILFARIACLPISALSVLEITLITWKMVNAKVARLLYKVVSIAPMPTIVLTVQEVIFTLTLPA